MKIELNNDGTPSKKDVILERFLTFKLVEETYGFPVSVVKEVLESAEFTIIPRTSAYMKGVFNLRGSVIPVIDIRILFNLGNSEPNPVKKDDSVIVVDVVEEDGTSLLGILADAVNEVVEISRDNIESGDRLSHAEFVREIGKKDENFILILDIDNIIHHIDNEINRLTENEEVSP